MPEPPPIRNNKRKTRGRLTNKEMREINEHGLVIPPRDQAAYEPNLNSHALLWNAGTLPGSKPFNYRVKAKANQKSAWNEYLEQRAEAEAKVKVNANAKRNKNTRTIANKRNNNGTRRALF